jgi:hypothetical protein
MATYGYSGSIETVTISVSGVYDITAYGAEGGASGNDHAGGFGAAIGGDIYLAAGTQLELAVGGAGLPGAAPSSDGTGGAAGYGGGGGGGGSFVIESYDGATHSLVDSVLGVAGGGGGGGGGPHNYMTGDGSPISMTGAAGNAMTQSPAEPIIGHFFPASAGGDPIGGFGSHVSTLAGGGISNAALEGGAGAHAQIFGTTFAGGSGGHGGFGGGGGGGAGGYASISYAGANATLGGGGGGGGGLFSFPGYTNGASGGFSYFVATSQDGVEATSLLTNTSGGAQAVNGSHGGNGEITLALVPAQQDTLFGGTSAAPTSWSVTNPVGPFATPWSLGAAPTALEANDLVVAFGDSILDSATANISSDASLANLPAEVIGGLELAGANLTLTQNLEVTGAAGAPFGGAGSTITVGTSGALVGLFVQSAVTNASGQVNVVHGTYDYAGSGATETVTVDSNGVFADEGALNTASVVVETGGVAFDSGTANADAITLQGGTFTEDGTGAAVTVNMAGGGLFVDQTELSAPVTNFGFGGEIATGATISLVTYTPGSPGAQGHLTFTSNGSSYDLSVTLQSGVTNPEFQVVTITDPATSQTMDAIELVVCFASGSRIRTAKGEVPVENLRVGDLAVTAAGEARPIVWIGHRRITNLTSEQHPVRVLAGAFGDGLPARDLRLSPGHAVCVDVMDEVFVPIDHLINGQTIFREDVAEETYWHVELESHDVLLADGLPCESYMDAGNRAFFGRAYGRLAKIDPDRVAESLTRYARPFVNDGPIVAAIRERLAARAEAAAGATGLQTVSVTASGR